MPKFKTRKTTKRELGKGGQARSGRLGGISKPLMNRRGRRK